MANNSKQISDCTGGRKGDAVRYCLSEQNIYQEYAILYKNRLSKRWLNMLPVRVSLIRW